MQRYVIISAAIVCAAFALRAATAVWWQSRLPDAASFAMPDSESYWYLAQTIAKGEPYQFGTENAKVFRTPGLPFVLACVFRVTGDESTVLNARILGCVLGAATVAVIMWLTGLLFDQATSLVAGILAAIYPGGVAMSILILSEGPFCLVMLLQLTLWILAWRAGTVRRQVALATIAGLLAGAAVLVRPSWLLFVPFTCGAGLLLGPRRRQHLLICLQMVLGVVVVMAPWWVRNYRITHRFVPTTLQVGASLYDGLNPTATGASDMQFASRFRRLEAERQQVTGDVMEYRLDARLRGEAYRFARNHPGRVLRLAGVKFLRMWNPWPNADQFGSTAFRLIVMTGFVPLAVCGVWGGWRFGRRGWPYQLCCLPAIYFTLLHMIFVSSIRYRQPAMLALIVLAAGVITPLVYPSQDRKAQGEP